MQSSFSSTLTKANSLWRRCLTRLPAIWIHNLIQYLSHACRGLPFIAITEPAAIRVEKYLLSRSSRTARRFVQPCRSHERKRCVSINEIAISQRISPRTLHSDLLNTSSKSRPTRVLLNKMAILSHETEKKPDEKLKRIKVFLEKLNYALK